MVASTRDFAAWLEQASVRESALSAEQVGLLRAAFRFLQDRGDDYYSTRVLGHFLLHCQAGLKVAQLARLLGLSRPTASKQQQLSSKQVIQQAHHRLGGRPHGKLLPRYAGPIAAFLLEHPHASRAEALDFIQATFGVRVSRIALYKFLKKFGLDHLPGGPAQTPPTAAQDASAPTEAAGAGADLPGPTLAPPASAPPFSSPGRSTRAPSC